MNEVTRTYFKNLAGQETGQSAADMRAILGTPADLAAAARLSAEPSFNSNFRTTCVATRLEAGHANNALAQTAQANVNCRIFPGHSPEEIRQLLIGIFADEKLSVTYVSDAGAVSDTAPERKAMVPPAPIKEVFDPLTRFTQALWPGTPVTAVMENGASDSIYLRRPAFPAMATRQLRWSGTTIARTGRTSAFRLTRTGSRSISSMPSPEQWAGNDAIPLNIDKKQFQDRAGD